MYTFGGLTLCKLGEEAPRLLNLKSESWGSTHRITICNAQDQARWFESLDRDVHTPKNLVLAAHADSDLFPNDHIGIFKIFNVDYVNRKADVGWDVFKHYREKGYGKRLVRAGSSFCFEILNLHRLDAEILVTNIGSIKCATAAQFVCEGTKRAAIHKNGQYIDSSVYGLLREEFK